MKIIFYSPWEENGNIHLNRLIDNFTVINGLEIYRSIENLFNRLCSPFQESSIIVLFILDNRTFDKLLPMKDLLNKNKLILVLPNHNPKTLNKAHQFKPRFISYTDMDSKYISDVIDKMLAADTKSGEKQTVINFAETGL